jgi:hypothetical protein
VLQAVGSIPDGVIRIFHSLNHCSHTVALGSAQPLTEMSTRGISWAVKVPGGRLTTLPPSCVDCLEILGASLSCSPKGLSRPV